MFCPNCGLNLPEGSAFCANCGAHVAVDEAPPQSQPQVQNEFQEQYRPPIYAKPKKKTAKMVGVIASAAVVIAVALILIFTLGGSVGTSSPEDAVKALAEAFTSMDVEAMLNIMPDFAVDSIADEYGLPAGSSRSVVAASARLDMDDYITYFQSAQFTDIKTKKIIKSSDSDFSDYLDDCMYEYNFDADDYKIEAFAEVTYKIKISYMGMTNTVETSCICIKVDGNWYIGSMDMSM